MNKTIRTRRREFFRVFFRGNWGYFLLAILASLCMSASGIMISWIMQLLIDAATGADGAMPIGTLLLLSLACMLLLVIGYSLAYHSTPNFIARAIGQYKTHVFSRLAQKNISAFSGENTARYVSALSNDANTIETNFLCSLFSIVEQVLCFTGALALMLWYSPMLTAVGIALSALPVAASLLAGDRAARAEKRLSDQNERYMSTLKDSLGGFSVVKSFRAEREMCALFAEQVRAVTQANSLRRKMKLLVQGLGIVSGCVAQVGVFIVGAWMAVEGMGISGGVIMAFVNLMNYVVNPIGTLPQYFAECRAAFALIDKLAGALEENVRDAGRAVPGRLARGICVRGLSFAYDGDKEILHEISAEFEAGGKYAIVGASGSGKSTLLKLLMAGYGNYTGTITLDGTELRTISSDSLYEMMSIVEQNVFVFNASIRDNITMFRDFPEAAVDEAIRLSGLRALIDRHGADYLCGENGSALSGGEKQRISIARSLLRRSQILLVDEATASLDAETAYQVSGAILALDGITRIVVTHALDEALLRQYDRIFTLKNGRLIESGRFDELIAQKGYFYSLFTVSQ